MPAPSLTAQPAAGFLPKEHGSWSLALEPLALGLLVAPTRAGIALAAAAFAGFLARRPLKGVFTAGPAQSRQAAGRTLLLFAMLVAAGLGVAVALAGVTALWPLLLAAPLGGLYVFFDAQGDARAAAAELAGSSAFAFLPAAMAVQAGWAIPGALTLAYITLARSAPTVLTIRTYLRLRKNQPAPPAIPLLAGTLALGLGLFLINRQLLPALSAAAMLLLLLRSLWFLGPWRPAWSARRMGISEAGLGVVYLAVVAVAYRFR